MKKVWIPVLVMIACVVMGIVDAIIQPGYIVKSVIKFVMFLLIPVLYSVRMRDNSISKIIKPEKKGIIIAVLLGVAIYIIILGAYFIFKNIFDFSGLTASLNKTTGVNKGNFIFVAIYISFVNSLLEEFFFRGFAFLILKKVASKKFAYIFSSVAFAVYHIAMMIGWFGVPVVVISLLGLFVGGLIFDIFDDIKDNIYLSWIVHMFANFAINTIGFILFA